MGGSKTWSAPFTGWTLTNINTTRHAGAVCIDDPTAGNGTCISPTYEATAIVSDGWRFLSSGFYRAPSTALKWYWRVGTSAVNCAAAPWIGPYGGPSEVQTAVRSELGLNLAAEAEVEGMTATIPYIQVKVVLMPS